MRSLAESRARWDATFAQISNLSDLRAAVKRSSPDSPCTSGLRSVCWKAFLVFENLDQSTWPKILRDSRNAYSSLKEHLLRDLKDTDDLSAIDPLAEDENNPWNTLRNDELLRAEIFQDVERCMPDNLYFREPATQTMLLDVLFIYCKLNPDVSYRQGMHELLAPILWVVSRDAISLKADEEGSSSRTDDQMLLSILSQRFIEHDAFTIFGVLMQTAKSFYETTGGGIKSATGSSINSAIVERSCRIHEEYLNMVDPELAQHLQSIDILPQIFLIRWIRLLFGREFPFEDVLCLWDVLFAEDPGLSLVDYVCVAMLIRVRWQILKADYSSALALLLRYPTPSLPHGPVTFVEDALYLYRDLTSQTASKLVLKYSGKPLDSLEHTATSSKTSFHTPRSSEDLSRTRSPMRFPGQVLQDSGGIEGLLQEAAKGVYKRSEQWGLSQAFRNAVHGLQSASNSPRRGSMARWSLDEGKIVNGTEDLSMKIQALEDRNKTLAKLLQESIDDISAQAKDFEKEKQDATATKLTLSVAKLQFLQVHLENSTMPLSQAHVGAREKIKDAKGYVSPAKRTSTPVTYTVQSTVSTAKPPPIDTHRQNSRDSEIRSPTRAPVRRPASVLSTPRVVRTESPKRFSFQSSRPSLAQSSFSWMLGDAENKSDFVSASPFSPEHDRKNAARGKAGFLFGDKDEGTAKERGKSQAEREDDDGFTLGTLKGVTKR